MIMMWQQCMVSKTIWFRKKKLKLILKLTTLTLAGHTFQHEIATACALDIFGSIDANRGDPQLGWDTDQFPNSVGRKHVSYV